MAASLVSGLISKMDPGAGRRTSCRRRHVGRARRRELRRRPALQLWIQRRRAVLAQHGGRCAAAAAVVAPARRPCYHRQHDYEQHTLQWSLLQLRAFRSSIETLRLQSMATALDERGNPDPFRHAQLQTRRHHQPSGCTGAPMYRRLAPSQFTSPCESAVAAGGPRLFRRTTRPFSALRPAVLPEYHV